MRVVNFFRSHTNSFDIPNDFNTGSRRSSASTTSFTDLSLSSGGSSISSVEEKERKTGKAMPELPKRLTFAGLTSRTPSPKSSPRLTAQHHSASLDFYIESPPLVYYGTPEASTGALLSGQIRLNIHDDHMAIDKLKMRLALEVTRKKPFHTHCQECSQQSKDLTTWDFLQGPATLAKGEHSFPFSFLLPGHLPATMKGELSSIDYVLRATVAPVVGEPMKLSRVLNIKRAVNPGDAPRNTKRVFPPTNLVANCEVPNAIHPIGQTTINMRVDGVVQRNEDTKSQTQWKVKRVMWQLEEIEKTVSPACPKHAAKLGNVDDSKKGMAHQVVRSIGMDEFKGGWKSDYTSKDGTVEIEFPIGVQASTKPLCRLKAEDGTEVSHKFIVELIIAEEYAPLGKPTQVTPTGGARILRMHFNITLTERAGLGISWDEEQPPLYENIPDSPPSYLTTAEPITDYEDLEPLDPQGTSSSSA